MAAQTRTGTLSSSEPDLSAFVFESKAQGRLIPSGELSLRFSDRLRKGESKAHQLGRLSYHVRFCESGFEARAAKTSKKSGPGEPSSALDAVRELAARRGAAAVDAIVVKPHWPPEYYLGARKPVKTKIIASHTVRL